MTKNNLSQEEHRWLVTEIMTRKPTFATLSDITGITSYTIRRLYNTGVGKRNDADRILKAVAKYRPKAGERRGYPRPPSFDFDSYRVSAECIPEWAKRMPALNSYPPLARQSNEDSKKDVITALGLLAEALGLTVANIPGAEGVFICANREDTK